MKKIKLFFYAFILLCAGLTGCGDPIPTIPNTDGWSKEVRVEFYPIKLSVGNSLYDAQNKYDGYWYGAYTPNFEITDFREIFGEGGNMLNYSLSKSEIIATSKSNRGSKSMPSYTKISDRCTYYYFYVWADVSSEDNFMSQELNIDIYSGPFKNAAGQQGNLYWNKKMFANAYSKSDLIWKDELKEEAILTAGKMQSVAAFKAISSGGGGGSGGGSSGGNHNDPNDRNSYIFPDGTMYEMDNSNLYMLDNTTSVLVDAHYNNNISTATSASDVATQEGTLTVYRRVSADTQISQ